MTDPSSDPGEHQSDDELAEHVDIGRESVARSAKWSLISLISKQGARIVFTIVLASMLGPENFGIIAQATIYLAFTGVFLDIGLGAALIQRKTLDRAVIGTATTLNLAVLSMLVLVTLVTADFWAGFFDTPQLASVLRVLSTTFIFNGLVVVPVAILTRRMEFRLLGIAEVVSTLIGGAAAIAAATAGAEYWALVVQTLTRDAIYMTIILVIAGRPVLAWSRQALASISRMSRNVFGGQLLNFGNQNADNFLIAWRLGPTALGNYGLSYRVLLLPVQILGQTANRLVFPIFSRLQDDPSRQARYYLETITSLALVVTPLMVLVALAAPSAVPLVFGPAWEAAIQPMRILAMGSILAALMTVNSPVLLAMDRADWLFRYSLVNTAGLVTGFAVGLRWGIEGVAWAYLVAGIPLGFLLLFLTGKLIPIGPHRYLAALAPAATGAAAMAATWWLVERSLGGPITGLGEIAVAAVAASVAFLGIVAIGWRDVLRRQIELVAAMAGRRAPPPP